ncbi:ABC transporter permease [Herpetosiphon giganteus]|uniref:ABC transporter permease n=1 Tax=Herpetosiphon giganteus TaxID=2029754 RepID=UPI00195B6CA9|nr:hypothetical protein [Herpetosiphon giganteus]MBM7842371.1 branched-chain amino acid transport system permease protein [Herpetosiphon giganteus]
MTACGGAQFSCSQLLLQLVIFGLANGAIIGLNAISVTLVYSVVRMLNFAHGDLFSLLTVLAAESIAILGLQVGQAWWWLGFGLLAVLLICGLVGAGTGVIIEQIGFRPFRGASRLAPLMATLGISFMLYQAALFVRTLTNAVIPGEHRSVPGIPEVARINVPDLLPHGNLFGDAALVLQGKDLIVVGLALLVAFGVHWLLKRTRFGWKLQASAADPTMAQLCGINYSATLRQTFALGGALAGLAALLFALYYTAPYTNYGAQSGLIAFTAALLGGIGRPLGALLSGLALGLLAAFSDYFIAAQWTPALTLGLLVLIVVLRQQPSNDSPINAAIVSTVQSVKQSWRWLLIPGLLACVPLLNSWFELGIQVAAIQILIYGLLALGLNVIVGWGGMLDLGYAAPFVLGAYLVALLSTGLHGGWQTWLASGELAGIIVVCCLCGGLFGWLIGVLAARLDNELLAIVTFALGVIAHRIAQNWRSVTNGASGIAGVPNLQLFGLDLAAPSASYYALLAVVVGVGMLGYNLLRSRYGRALAALASDELAAASVGVEPIAIRRLAYTWGGSVAALAGGLFAASFSYISPGLAEFRVSAIALIIVVLAGSRRIIAPLIAACLVLGYDLLLIPKVGKLFDDLREQTGNWFWSAINPRGANFLSFGLMLYLTVLYRARARRV